MRNFKTLLGCIGILFVAIDFCRADGLDMQVLRENLRNLPGVYEKLVREQKCLEASTPKTDILGIAIPRPRPKFCFEETVKGEKFTRSARDIDFQVLCVDPINGGYVYLFGFIEGFVHRLPVVEDWFLRDRSLKQVRSAVFRSAFVLPSEKFVRSILGDAFFEALLLQYNKGGTRLGFRCTFRSPMYDEHYESVQTASGVCYFRIPKDLLPTCIDRLTAHMEDVF